MSWETVRAAFAFVADAIYLASRGWRLAILVQQVRLSMREAEGRAADFRAHFGANVRVLGWTHPRARRALNAGATDDFFSHREALAFEAHVLEPLLGTDRTSSRERRSLLRAFFDGR